MSLTKNNSACQCVINGFSSNIEDTTFNVDKPQRFVL